MQRPSDAKDNLRLTALNTAVTHSGYNSILETGICLCVNEDRGPRVHKWVKGEGSEASIGAPHT